MISRKEEIILEFNKLSFISPHLVDICDNLEETVFAKREFKFHLKRANIEAQKIVDQHFAMYRKAGTLYDENGENGMDGEDIYNTTAKAYDFVLKKSPNEICVIAEVMQRLERDGLDYRQVSVFFESVHIGKPPEESPDNK